MVAVTFGLSAGLSNFIRVTVAIVRSRSLGPCCLVETGISALSRARLRIDPCAPSLAQSNPVVALAAIIDQRVRIAHSCVSSNLLAIRRRISLRGPRFSLATTVGRRVRVSSGIYRDTLSLEMCWKRVFVDRYNVISSFPPLCVPASLLNSRNFTCASTGVCGTSALFEDVERGSVFNEGTVLFVGIKITVPCYRCDLNLRSRVDRPLA